ncbi:hypothetical protein NKJ88_05835 [Mesorhizobium sp. M0016]|uniref:hypothetical protein n=1 Tax=Mesorhizobium sp. M0016 TaxID=2956843 RepID=UPI0033381C84
MRGLLAVQFTGIIRNWTLEPYTNTVWGTDAYGKPFHTARVKELNRSAGYATTWSGHFYKLEEEKVDA